MHKQSFLAEIIGPQKDTVKIDFPGNLRVRTAFDGLIEYFQKMLARGYSRWIINLEKVEFPPASMIAFLISATEQARFKHGDLKIINASSNARNNIMTFNPLAYLSTSQDGFHAFQELQTEEKMPVRQERKAELWENDNQRIAPSESANAPGNRAETNPAEIQATAPAPEKVEQRIHSKSASKPPADSGKMKRYYLRTESIASHLYKICDFVVEHSFRAGIDEKQITKSKIAVYEACLNVIEHAYHSRPDNWIEVWVEYDDSVFRIIIQDYGLSFDDQRESQQYNVEAAMEKRQTGGFGLHIIERSMDEVNYTADKENGNRLTLVKYL